MHIWLIQIDLIYEIMSSVIRFFRVSLIFCYGQCHGQTLDLIHINSENKKAS